MRSRKSKQRKQQWRGKGGKKEKSNKGSLSHCSRGQASWLIKDNDQGKECLRGSESDSRHNQDNRMSISGRRVQYLLAAFPLHFLGSCSCSKCAVLAILTVTSKNCSYNCQNIIFCMRYRRLLWWRQPLNAIMVLGHKNRWYEALYVCLWRSALLFFSEIMIYIWGCKSSEQYKNSVLSKELSLWFGHLWLLSSPVMIHEGAVLLLECISNSQNSPENMMSR